MNGKESAVEVRTEQHALPPSASSRQMVFGLAGGLVAWALQLIIVYAPVSYACRENVLMGSSLLGLTTLQVVQLVVTVIAGAIVLGATLVSLSYWRRLRETSGPDGLVMEDSPYPFLMFVSMALNGLFLLAVVASLVPILLIEPCAWQIVG
jgi:hypothetical protein